MSEEALTKTGVELFRELLRLYETAEVEDYYKVGQWKNDLLKTDLILIEAHRKEAGAPDPPDLEDVVVPEMPGAFLRAPIAGLTLPTLGIGVPAAGGLTTPVAELRLIALFVAKWKLEPTKTKMLLAKLTPLRRRYVMQHFKALGSGDAATTELESFLAECGRNGMWDKGGLAGVVQPGQVLAAKRPLLGAPALDPSKRPRFGVPQLVQSPSGLSLAERLAAARAASPGVRPMLVKPTGPITGIRPPGRPVAPFLRPAGPMVIRPGVRPVLGQPRINMLGRTMY